MDSRRSRVNDGWRNRLETHVTTHYQPAWDLAGRVEPVRRRLNRALINRAALKMPTRPEPLSAMAGYTSWESLTDRGYGSRHLPPAAWPDGALPAIESAAELFVRGDETVACPKSTVMFAYFAQWFTDGFLRSDRSAARDPRRNDSTHEIDLCQIYGLRPAVTRQLRSFQGGRLKSQTIDGAEFPPYLYESGKLKPEFDLLSVVRMDQVSPRQRDRLFATGSDTANAQLGFLMMTTLLLREHNRIAGLLAAEYPSWDDERLYATARNIMIVLTIKLVIGEYINHIAPYHFKFSLDPSTIRNEPWYRQNWMSVEFNLLYRWHSLIPSTLRVGGDDLTIRATLYDTELLTRNRLGALFEEASTQPAGRVGLFNTDAILREVEESSLRTGREVQLAPYNDYRVLCGFPRVTDFDQISGDQRVQRGLSELYGSVDRIEFYAGIFAEDLRPNSVLPPLIGRMVGVDAFSQALTNPLLAQRVYHEGTFSPLGMELIRGTRSLSQVLNRNVPESSRQFAVTLTRRDWQRERA